MIENMKICACCKEEKPSTSFHKKQSTKDGLHNYCKPCVAKKNKEWVLNNKERHKNTCSNWYKANKDKANKRSTEWHYQTYYGISYSDFLTLANTQNNKCQICSVDLTFGTEKKATKAVLDHCHTTGKIRGVLCSACNTALGKFKDDTLILSEAINYLIRNKN